MAKTRMRRNRLGQFVGKSGRRRTTSRKSRKSRRRTNVPALAANRPYTRKRASGSGRRSSSKRRYTKRRSYRRNPALFGIPFNLQTIGFTAGGLLGTSYLEGFVRPYLPTAITGNVLGRYAVKLGSAFGLYSIVRMFGFRTASRAVLVGGMSSVALSAINEFIMPALTGSASTGRYLGAQPLLGANKRRSLGAYPSFGGLGVNRISSGVPDRLDPASRF